MDSATSGIVNIIIGIATLIVGSYFIFIINTFKEKMNDCRENCTNRIKTLEDNYKELSQTVFEIKGSIG